MEPRAPTWRSRLTWISAGTAIGAGPGKRTGACVVRQPHGQPQDAVPEAVAETPVTRYILSPRGDPWSSAGRPSSEPRSVFRSAESGSTKVPSQEFYKALSPACTRTHEYLGPEFKSRAEGLLRSVVVIGSIAFRCSSVMLTARTMNRLRCIHWYWVRRAAGSTSVAPVGCGRCADEAELVCRNPPVPPPG
jgi:hypothetical protein